MPPDATELSRWPPDSGPPRPKGGWSYSAAAMAAYKLTVRRRGNAARERFASLPEALTALEARLDDLTPDERRGRERALSRELAPVEQVALRGEVAGPGVRGGVDVRGDGSAEAFTGRWRRVLVEREAGETAYDALRRALGA